MSKEILQVNQVTARVEDKEILHGVSLDIKKGETHVLMGPNGAGKSTLGYVLTGNPKYQVTQGHIIFNGEDMTETSACFFRFRSHWKYRGFPWRALSEMHWYREQEAM